MKTLLIIILSIVGFSATAQTTNYTGHWKLNLQKSQLGTIPAWVVSYEFDVKQQKDNITISTTSYNDEGQTASHTTTENIGFDDKTYDTVNFVGDKVSSQIKWSDNSKEFTKTTKSYKDGNLLATRIEKWSIVDERTLHVTRDVEQAENQYKYTVQLVFEKEK